MSAMFSQEWVDRWRSRINSNEAYAKAAEGWRGGLALVVEGEGNPSLAILLDLDSGRCERGRRLGVEEVEDADYVLTAPESTWLRMMRDRKDPVWALMSGKLKLAKGSMSSLLPFAGAARELLATASELDDQPAPIVESSDGLRLTSGARSQYASISATGLDRSSPAMRLWEKAKVRGVWNPADVDLARDRDDWARLSDDERDLLSRLTSLFLAGEEAVTLDLLPLVQCIAGEGRLEEEIFLTSFLWEEAKHVDAFSRFFDDVAAARVDLDRYHSPSYRALFYEELPRALDRLRTDTSPTAQAEASVTYHMIVEGVLAETGYHGYYRALERGGVLPGMLELVSHIQSDEARHLAYGVFLLSRLVAEHGEEVWKTIESRMEHLLPLALQVVEEAFEPYEPVPFGLSPADFAEFAQDQFRRRFARVEKARRQTLDEVYRVGGEPAPAQS